jgi:hypothetical protein
MQVQWWSLADGEWEGLDARYVHYHFWIGKFNDLYILELCNPVLHDEGIVIAAKNDLDETKEAAEEYAQVIFSHLNADFLHGKLPF